MIDAYKQWYVEIDMQGMKAIAKQYDLKVNQDSDLGPFQWKRRMGIHLAFHRDPLNIVLHAVFSIVNAWALLLIFYPFQLSGLNLFSVPLDMAMVILVATFIIYALMDIGAALLVTIAFALTYPLCAPVMELLQGSTGLMLALGIFLTFLALAVQVFIGHNIAEKGIDDAVDNFKELFESKNPLYITLLPFYTYLDLLFMAGYKPKTAQFIWSMTNELRPKLEAEQKNI